MSEHVSNDQPTSSPKQKHKSKQTPKLDLKIKKLTYGVIHIIGYGYYTRINGRLLKISRDEGEINNLTTPQRQIILKKYRNHFLYE